MRIAIATVQVPFVSGGAEYLAQGLKLELIKAGHDAEIVTAPFRFGRRFLSADMAYWKNQDFSTLDINPPDAVVALKFPAYLLKHPRKAVWLLHQHRSVYDLLDTTWGEQSSTQGVKELKEEIEKNDRDALGRTKALFTIADTVTQRLLKHNGVKAETLYHPPPSHDLLNPNGALFPYVFAPSRLEQLKRQDLLIKAMPFVDKDVTAVICGTGGMHDAYRRLANQLGVDDRIRFTGHVSNEQMRRYFSNALAVFFGPYAEDLGYVTLEAMLSAKPVITCHDSGGATEFVVHGETGVVADPEPEQIAHEINMLWGNRKLAKQMGRNALQHYRDLNISWENVVHKLTDGLK